MPEVSLDSGNGRPLIVVSNREPYQHVRRDDGSIAVAPTTGGVSVALDALMRERGGTWIAYGAGNADADVVDANDRVTVPPDKPSYTLRRVWLSPEEERSLLRRLRERGSVAARAHRPRPAEISQRGLGGVPTRQRAVRRGSVSGADRPPDLRLHSGLSPGAASPRISASSSRLFGRRLFWHIPWPHPDRLRMCPWRRRS